MRETVHVLRAADPRWNGWINGADADFQHTAGFHQLAETAGEGRAYMVVCAYENGFFAWPYLLRDIPNTIYSDVTSVYGYSGPVAVGINGNQQLLARARKTVHEVWESQNVVSAFTRFHPLLGNQGMATCGQDSNVSVAGYTVSIDVSLPAEPRWKNYHRQLQQNIRRSRELGLRTELDFEWRYLPEFEEVYACTMQRNNASPYYLFSHQYFVDLKRILGEHGFLAIVWLRDQPISVCLVIRYNGIVNTFLAGTARDHLPLSPFKTLVHDLTEYAHVQGCRTVHLGGGRGGKQDSLFRFKAAFSPARHEFCVGRWVLNESVYRLLAGERETDFFPAYRAPAPTSESAVAAAAG